MVPNGCTALGRPPGPLKSPTGPQTAPERPFVTGNGGRCSPPCPSLDETGPPGGGGARFAGGGGKRLCSHSQAPRGYCAYLVAPLPPAPGAIRARILFTLGGKPTIGCRVFFGWTGTAPTPAALSTLADTFATSLSTHTIAHLLHPDNKYTGVILTALTSDMAPEAEAHELVTGTRTPGGPLPVDACFVTSYEITRKYRGGHPRSSWPFGTDNDLTTPQKWKSASVTAFLGWVTSYVRGFTHTATGTHMAGLLSIAYYQGFTAVENPITHRYRNVPRKRTPALLTAVTGVIGRSYVGSQRRRRLVPS